LNKGTEISSEIVFLHSITARQLRCFFDEKIAWFVVHGRSSACAFNDPALSVDNVVAAIMRLQDE
jgi:hypothetical protein